MSRADGSDAATRGPTRRTLPLARRALVAAIARDTPGTDQPRLVKVLDALIAWSVARPTLLAFRDDERRGDVLAFVCAGTTVVCWSAQVTRGVGPRLEIYPPTGRSLSAEQRAMVIRTVNAHARQALIDGDRLWIGFGALKNDAARTAVLALLEELLAVEATTAKGADVVAKRAPRDLSVAT